MRIKGGWGCPRGRFILLGLRHIGRCCNMHPPHIKSNTSFRYTRLIRCTIQQIVSSSYILGEILHISELSRNRLMSSSIACLHKQIAIVLDPEWGEFFIVALHDHFMPILVPRATNRALLSLHNMNREWTYTFLTDRATLIRWTKLY